jgi:hypothetical protein
VSFDAYLAQLADAHVRDHGMPIPADPDPETMNRLLILHGTHAAVETGRLLDTVQWKWWAGQEDRWERAAEVLYGELLPRWCLMVLCAGMDAASVTELYMKKNALNLERQQQGYKEGTYRKVDSRGREDNVKLFEK